MSEPQPATEAPRETAEIISLDARRVSRALQHAQELEEIALDYGPREF